MNKLILGLFFSAIANAQAIKCDAKVTLYRWSVQVDTETREMKVSTEKGAYFEGTANHTVIPSRRSHIYYLATYHNDGLSLEVPDGGGLNALCLNDSECYGCK